MSRELLARAWQAGAGPGDAPLTVTPYITFGTGSSGTFLLLSEVLYLIQGANPASKLSCFFTPSGVLLSLTVYNRIDRRLTGLAGPDYNATVSIWAAPSQLGCPLSLKTANMGNPGLVDSSG